MRSVKREPVVAVELAAFDLHLSPKLWDECASRRVAGPHCTLTAGLRQKISIRRPDVTAALDIECLAAGVVDEVRTFTAATGDRHRVALRGPGVDVRLPRLLEPDAFDGWDRSRADENRGAAGLKIAANHGLLQRVGIRGQQPSSAARQPKAVEEQILRAHETGAPDFDADRTAIEEQISEGVRLQRGTAGGVVPIEIEDPRAGRAGEPHPLETRIAAAVGDEDRRAWRDVLDLRDEAPGADDPSAVKIFDCQWCGDLVV